ncbi:hypothetical protein QUC32_14260 [Novosphingobium resinovorum]|uniref:Uncharacterized protein n=1 Tax=Novosphingobium resinovorum TaxID=158500 RepID=A0A1D8A075_9SPHN|nr:MULTISPECIES: hypothetical protein [Novosphingobium]AOR75517.1 hypothetical protein BES08_01150 [Novosphingobium resinovorum]MBF7010835.1 hypothetical protein [Novosphingobium sp. HR1a]WJM28833.1 hypothetical protein QUC32_14260 [Novosphingobium resinovorum]
MIDRQKRDEAASLIARFASGEIDSDDLESDWPTSKEDRALEAVGSMLWLHYDDHKPRLAVGKDAANPEELTLFARYQAYLHGDLPYEWPEDSFIRIEGLGALVPLSLGLLRPVDRIIKARNAKIDAAMEQHGDLSVWPFTSRSQWDGEPIAPYVR